VHKVDYFRIINKYISPYSQTYNIYVPHVTLVTAKAIKIGRKLKLGADQLRFIEEASMLHDIGIVHVKAKEIFCNGEMPYIYHIVEGRKILEAEGLPMHAKIAENHIGVGGLSKEEIISRKIPLPHRDMLCETIEEKIISYADLWYSKKPQAPFYREIIETGSCQSKGLRETGRKAV